VTGTARPGRGLTRFALPDRGTVIELCGDGAVAQPVFNQLVLSRGGKPIFNELRELYAALKRCRVRKGL